MALLLDPWDDAAFIAARLASAGNRLIVIVGAEAWCEKCRELKPHFEAMAANASRLDLMLWLDLEEHQEFMGDYIPEDLPELLIYRQGKLVHRSPLDAISQQALRQALVAESEQQHIKPQLDAPGIAKRLAEPNWAKSAGKQ